MVGMYRILWEEGWFNRYKGGEGGVSSPAYLLGVEDCILQGIEVTDTISGSLVFEVVTPFKGITLLNGFSGGDEEDDLPFTNHC